MPVIYIDVLFLINFIMDSILLVLTGRVSGENLSPWRILIGGFSGGLYSISVFFAPLSFMSAWIIKLVVSGVMIFLSFGYFSAKKFFRHLLNFYLSSFLLGGGLAALFYFSDRPGIMSNGIYYFPLSFFQLILIGLPLGFCLSFYFKKTKNRLMQFDKHCSVTVFFKEKSMTLEGIIDTGCSLVDPYLNIPVIIIGQTAAVKLLNKDYRQALIDCQNLCLIPYNTISGAGNFLYGFKPDKVIITLNEKSFLCSCTVAISPDFSGDKIIINPNVLSYHN